MESKPSTSSSMESSQPCRIFEYHEILSATDNLDESLVIGQGGFGKVYQGLIVSGPTLVVAAIKRLDSLSSQGATEFWAEVKMLSKLRHCNLVSLFGYCNHEKEMILVYEYMPNGTLEDHLHKRGTPLSWLQRLKICIGAARGLDYLHTGTGIESGVIHRDIKTSNILLNESWAAKISDFGLSKIGLINQTSTYVNTLVKGTFGYLDPNYYVTGKLTRKSDVYAFGVVLLEVLFKKRAVDRSLEEGLVTWAQDSIKEGNLKDIIDSDIKGQISTKCLKKFVQVVERCLLSSPKQRPMMAEVVVSLDSVLTLQEKANSINTSLKVLKFANLKRATRDFSQDFLLSTDGYSEVFLGWVDENTFVPSTEGVGIAIAVKRYKTEYLQFGQKEVTILGHLAHPNIISLVGYCDGKKLGCLLVHEYMQNRNLGHFLFTDVAEPLSWETRLKIMIGIARGLAYMHSLKDQVIHRDVNPSNILLDKEFNAKLGGFRFARFVRESSDYVMRGHYSVKNDIYGFGIVLVETITGQRVSGRNPPFNIGVVEWATVVLAERSELKKDIDPRLGPNYPLKSAFECVALALKCVAMDRKDRPSSEEVLMNLERIYIVDR